MTTDDTHLNCLGIPHLTPEQMGPEIAERIRCARQWCQHHWNLLCNPMLHSRPKFYIYKTFVRPILTYGCELWNLSSYESKKLLRFETGVLMEIFKSKYPHRHPKRLKPALETVYEKYRGTDVIYHVKSERLRWTVLLKSENNALRNIRQQCRRSVHWWDRPYKSFKQSSTPCCRPYIKERHSSTSRRQKLNLLQCSENDSTIPSPSKMKDTGCPERDKPSTSKQNDKRNYDDPG